MENSNGEMAKSKSTFQIIAKNPMIFLSCTFVGFLYSLIDYYNPLPSIFLAMDGFGGKWIGTALSLMQMFVSPTIIGKIILVSIMVLLIASFVIGVVVSGLMYAAKEAVIGRKSTSYSLCAGINENLGKNIKATFYFILSLLSLVVLLFLAVIPSLFNLWENLNGRAQMLPLFIVITAIAIIAVAIVFIYYLTYSFFWFSLATFGEKKFIGKSIETTNEKFWSVCTKATASSSAFIMTVVLSTLLRYEFPSNLIQSGIYQSVIFILEGIAITVLALYTIASSIGDSLKVTVQM